MLVVRLDSAIKKKIFHSRQPNVAPQISPLSEDFLSAGFKISVTAILIRRRAMERRYLQSKLFDLMKFVSWSLTWLQDRDGRRGCGTHRTGGSPERRPWIDFSCEHQAPGWLQRERGTDFPPDSGLRRNCSPSGRRHRPRRVHIGTLLWGSS